MIRSARQLQDAQRIAARIARPWLQGWNTHTTATVHFQASFAAVIRGNTMYYDNMAEYQSLCYCSQSEFSEPDIFPRLYEWEAPWGGIQNTNVAWGQGPVNGTAVIKQRATLAVNSYELSALDLSCFGNGCPRCDPRCRIAMNAVPDGTPVIMNVGKIASLFQFTDIELGVNDSERDQLGPLYIHWFAHYMDPPSCVCDYDAHPEHCV